MGELVVVAGVDLQWVEMQGSWSCSGCIRQIMFGYVGAAVGVFSRGVAAGVFSGVGCGVFFSREVFWWWLWGVF